MINVDWNTLKTFVQNRNLSIQYVLLNNVYHLRAFDGIFSLSTELSYMSPTPIGSEQEDFENNFQSNGNKKLELLDSDGSPLQRLKVTTTGWSLHYHGIEITTSDLNGSIDLDQNNEDYGFATIKLYDEDDTLIADSGDVPDCVKTVVDWEPTFNFDIIGGDVFLATPPSTDIRVSVIGIPDIPTNMGGSKVFMTGFNLKHVSPLGIHLDGKTPKSAIYNPVLHTNKIRFVFHHDAGVSQTVLVMLNIFKA